MGKRCRLNAIGIRFKTKSSIKNDTRNATIFATSINVVFWIHDYLLDKAIENHLINIEKMALMNNQPSTASTTKRIREDYLYTKKTFIQKIIIVENYLIKQISLND